MKRFVRSQLVGLVAAVVLLCACSASEAVEPVAAEAPTLAPALGAEPTASVPIEEPTATPVPAATPLPEPTATAVPTATPPPTATPAPTPSPVPTLAAIADVDHSGLAGTRGLTVQWISWEPEDWGAIEFVPLVDGTYAVSGTQDGPDGDFVTVDGVITRVGDRELLFSGEVVVRVSYTNDGQPCVRNGDITFLATGERRFWRMQDLINCDGIVTDYVDIYFG